MIAKLSSYDAATSPPGATLPFAPDQLIKTCLCEKGGAATHGDLDRMTLPMSWDEWAQHDGVALAARVRKGELTATELARQAAAGIAKVNPALSGVVEVFEDAIADPGQGRRQSRRAVRRPALPDEGSRPDDEGPAAGNGLAADARQSRDGRYVPDRRRCVRPDSI